jgi:hypothetical protein
MVMGEVDRRGFMRLLRRSDPGDDKAKEEAAEAPLDPDTQQLADLTAALLKDVEEEGSEQLAEAPLMTKPYDKAYMRVTRQHIVFSIITGFSIIIKTSDVTALNQEPPEEARGYGLLVVGVLRAHHPADLPDITRAYQFRFPAESPLLEAIRTACNLPEPEPEPAESEDSVGAADQVPGPGGADGGNSRG